MVVVSSVTLADNFLRFYLQFKQKPLIGMLSYIKLQIKLS